MHLRDMYMKADTHINGKVIVQKDVIVVKPWLFITAAVFRLSCIFLNYVCNHFLPRLHPFHQWERGDLLGSREEL